MNLGLCIANLLKRYPAVDVPGIGVFKITHVPAVYDESAQVLLPPSSQIELATGENGGFPITKYLRKQRNLDEAKARVLLGQAVASIMDTMSRNGQVLLDGLGYLLVDGASLLLKPFDTSDFGWKPVGFQRPVMDGGSTTIEEPVGEPETIEVISVDVPAHEDIEAIAVPEPPEVVEISDDRPEVEKQENVANVVVSESVTTELQHVTHVEAVQEEGADMPADADSRQHGGRVWGWLGASAAVLIGIGAWAWFKQPEWFERFGFAQVSQTLANDSIEPKGENPGEEQIAAVADSVMDSPTQEVEDAGPAANEASVSQPVTADSAKVVAPAPVVPEKPAVTYEIIVGSFATMAQADKYVAQMKAKGFTLHAINSRMPGNRKKISWGSYATEEEAYRELARVQKTFEPGAWIAKVDNR